MKNIWDKIVTGADFICGLIGVLFVLSVIYVLWSGDACFRYNNYSWGSKCDKYVTYVEVTPQVYKETK
jgi:hypothetical protein